MPNFNYVIIEGFSVLETRKAYYLRRIMSNNVLPGHCRATAIISGLAEREKTDHGRLIEISWEATMATVDKQGVVTITKAWAG